VQVPAAINVAVVLETVQMLAVVDVKVTAKPELAVAESDNGIPTVCVPGFVKVMVCNTCATVTGDEVPVALL
jgi:hypothetical protein